MPSYVPPEKNIAYVFYVSLVSQANTKIAQVNPTLAAGDVKVAVDDAAPANLATLPVVDADFTKRVKVSLSTSEMNGDNVTVIFSDAAGSEWCDLTINIQTVARQLDDLAFPATAGRSIQVETDGMVHADVKEWLASAPNALQTGRVDAYVGAMAANVLTATAINADAITNAKIAADAIGSSEFAQAAADQVWSTATRTLTALGFALTNSDAGWVDVNNRVDVGLWLGLVPNALQSGRVDAYVGAVAAGVVAGDVWDRDASLHQTLGSFGGTIGDQVTDGDTIWSLCNTNLDALMSSRSSHSAADVWTSVTRTLTALGFTLSDTDASWVDASNRVDVGRWLSVAPNALQAGRVDAYVGALAAGVITDAGVGADAFDDLFKRDMDQVEVAAAAHSLCTAVLKAVSRVRDNAGTLETYRTDGLTIKLSQTVTTDAAADPVDELSVGT